MSSRDTENGEAGRNTPRTGRKAWAGRAILALMPLAILATTGHHMLHQRLEEQFRRFGQERIRAPLPEEARRLIDKGVEDAFAPVYDRIPEFLDWHYSFFGQYTELGLMLVGRLEGEIESRLLGGLEGRISATGEDVGRVMQEEMLVELERWFDRDVASLPPGPRAAYERMLGPVLEDAKRRFTVSIGPTAVGAAMAGVGTSVGVRALVTGLAERLVGGAAVRSGVSALGRAVGLIVAAGVAVGVDIALRELDEMLHREELERELTALVDEQKERVRAALLGAVDDVKAEALGNFIPAQLR